jgi:uncharacterized protein
MEIADEQILAAPKEVVWQKLNDPGVLRICIPGCESLESDASGRMTAAIVTKVGPIKARFEGEVQLEDIVAPISYSIVGEGKGGIAGFAKGRADIMLEDHAEGTLLKYKVTVNIGGKIAQLGGRLITATSKKLSEQFFSALAANISQVGGEDGLNG